MTLQSSCTVAECNNQNSEHYLSTAFVHRTDSLQQCIVSHIVHLATSFSRECLLLQPWLDELRIVPAAILTTHKHWSVLVSSGHWSVISGQLVVSDHSIYYASAVPV